MANDTPMMRQYKAAKAQHPDDIIFFRLGDFYEMFFDDALLVSRELGLTLTSRSGDVQKNPMCGVPYRKLDTYVARLLAKGHKVAVVEQIGDPKAPGLTRREVVQIVTPGTVLSDDALPARLNNYLALVREADAVALLAVADVSTGEFLFATYAERGALTDALYRLTPSELVIVGTLTFADELDEFLRLRMPNCALTRLGQPPPPAEADALLLRHFADQASLPEDANAKAGIAALLAYLHDTVRGDLSHINRLQALTASEFLALDQRTLRNLELTRNLRDGGKANTLFDVLDSTQTAMGCRLLKKWLETPLLALPSIDRRLSAVAELVQKFTLRGNLVTELKKVYDLERLLTRVQMGTATARELVALKRSFATLPMVRTLLSDTDAVLLQQACEHIATYDDLAALIGRALADDPEPGCVIKPGYSAELDDYRHLARDSKGLLQEMEERERKSTGIKGLKLGYNRVFGYYLEVRKSAAAQVPERYIRKQTLTTAERYVTQELKDFETRILGSEEKIAALERQLFAELCAAVVRQLGSIQATARELAVVDVLQSLADAAARYNYVRPQLSANGDISITDGRHPLVERMLLANRAGGLFVPNDTALNHSDCEIAIITGPNMAGKSTYMRQTALITLMAQAGSFVPARKATITPVDRIFTRIGASDDLVSGQSTFMVEMTEVAQILQCATRRSLVILDEVGRGTSTYDGMSIARAVLEFMRDRVHAKTMFATHYHELTDLAGERVKNFSVAVKEQRGEVTFLRRVKPGGADKSYGLYVAKFAGLPKVVIKRAQKILDALEQSRTAAARTLPAPPTDPGSATLTGTVIAQELLALDVPTLTPIEALNALYKLQQLAKQELGVDH